MTILFLAALLQDYWISELGSDDIDRRDQITQVLLARGRWDSLYAARKKARDSEVRARLDLVLRAWWRPFRYGIGNPTTSISWSWDERMDRYTARLSGTGILEITHRHGWTMPQPGFEEPALLRLDVGPEVLRLCLLAMETRYFDTPVPPTCENEGGGVILPNDWSVTYRSGTGFARSMSGTGTIRGRFRFYEELCGWARTALMVGERVRRLESKDLGEEATRSLIAAGAVALPTLRALRTTDPELKARVDSVVRAIEKLSGRAIRQAGFAQKE